MLSRSATARAAATSSNLASRISKETNSSSSLRTVTGRLARSRRSSPRAYLHGMRSMLHKQKAGVSKGGLLGETATTSQGRQQHSFRTAVGPWHRNLSTTNVGTGGGRSESIDSSASPVLVASVHRNEIVSLAACGDEEEGGDVLAWASARARQIASLASSSSISSPSLEPSLHGKEALTPRAADEALAIDAADALLSLTSPPSFRSALLLHSHDSPSSSSAPPLTTNREVIPSLHRAFLSVSSSLLSTATSSASVRRCLDLCLRSESLILPLHRPLYGQLAMGIATHCPFPGTKLLELSASLDRSFGSVEATFFSRPMLELARRHKMGDVVDVIKGMKGQHGLNEVEFECALELLEVVKEGVDDLLVEETRNIQLPPMDESDAMELTLLLQGPLLRRIKERRARAEEVQRKIGETINSMLGAEGGKRIGEEAMEKLASGTEEDDGELELELLDSNEEDDDDDEDEALDEDDVVADLAKFAELLNDQTGESVDAEAVVEAVEAVSSAGAEAGVASSTRNNVNSSEARSIVRGSLRLDEDGLVQDVDVWEEEKEEIPSNGPPTRQKAQKKKADDRFHNQLANEFVYLRDSDTWSLPDVTEQLVKLNGGRDVMFTKEYEKQIIMDVMAEEDGEESFDKLR